MADGKLIVIDGVDGSGKETQTGLLQTALINSGVNVKKIEFPNYSDNSSALIKMYLAGEFGKSAEAVNPYAASTFYAVDRFASYKQYWEDEYKSGKIILADRYVSSNAIHQASKLTGKERDDYLSWLYDFEYEKIELPKPDAVIFLDMPPEYAAVLINKRYSGDQSKKDLHEKDISYMKKCYESAIYACEKLGWIRIPCVLDGEILSANEIHSRVLAKVKEILKN